MYSEIYDNGKVRFEMSRDKWSLKKIIKEESREIVYSRIMDDKNLQTKIDKVKKANVYGGIWSTSTKGYKIYEVLIEDKLNYIKVENRTEHNRVEKTYWERV